MAKSPRSGKRTAVLVVHGMGSQRPLDTVRGVVNAIWLENSRGEQTGQRRMWTHPERTGTDIDLPVMTTNSVPGTERRHLDFHELYWAHLMSETRAVAVLLWLFELARKGPRLKPEMRALYWCATIYLALLILSISLIALQGIIWYSNIAHERSALLIGPLLMLLVAGVFSAIASLLKGAGRLLVRSLLVCAAMAIVLYILEYCLGSATTEAWAPIVLPVLVAAVAVWLLMGSYGLLALAFAYGLSAAFLQFQLWYLAADWSTAFAKGWLPWSLTSHWSMAAAWLFIGLYLILNAAFLQPYLGDAARYFRNSPGNVAVRREIRKQAVDTLEALHCSGEYDRIVVVAHSLGTVVAYDMLRAYYGRVNQDLPDPSQLGPDFDEVDDAKLKGKENREKARRKGRGIVAWMAKAAEAAQQRIMAGAAKPDDKDLRVWLVTDFVTLGSPLTHAHYLMCRGRSKTELEQDFERRKREREFPVCPPPDPGHAAGDGWLTYVNPNNGQKHFHHGGQFALTRWTNLYFPLSQLLWGDAIGGPLAPVFGDHVADVPVHTTAQKTDSFFAHVLYWDFRQERPPHIEALQNAIDFADSGVANGLGS
jgi:hypothetical protein